MARATRDAAGLTAAEKTKLERRLEREREAALEALKSREETARAAEQEVEPMDAAELAREQGDAALFLERTRARLRDVDDALARLRAGTYGLSEASGDPIGYRRLEAIPWARRAADEDGTSGAREERGLRPPPPEPRVSDMPTSSTTEKAKKDLARGKRPSTAAGEFVREEIEHVRRGVHGARSTRQAIAIGLSKARRAGVPLEPPGSDRAKPETRRAAARDYALGQGKGRPRAPSPRRARAAEAALKREGRKAASRSALSAQAKRAAATRKRGR
jgi:RNA polymerase-binding transcription factor DksA